MPQDSYTLIRDTESGDTVRLDFKWTMRGNTMTDFSINVSLLEGEGSTEIYRIDTGHGYIHEHKFWRSPKPERLDMSHKRAFVEKKEEVLQNYAKWVVLFKEYRE